MPILKNRQLDNW